MTSMSVHLAEPDQANLLIAPEYQLFTSETSSLSELSLRCNHSFNLFQQSWNYLEPDGYLKAGEHYRYRRYAVFNWVAGQLTAMPCEPHYQERHFNALYGGIERHYQPWAVATQANSYFRYLLVWLGQHLPGNPMHYRIQAHQFRIYAGVEQGGKPSPEGIHKDGSDYTFIHLLQCCNISGGVSQMYDNAKHLVEQITLEKAGDSILLNDKSCYHNTTAIKPKDPRANAYRDVLVLTFHANSTD